MISYLEGAISDIGKDSIVIDIGGVGYEVFIPTTLLANLPSERETTRIYIHHIFREDGQTLYGFLSKKDRELFRCMLSVSGIGPKVGLNIMSSMPAERFVDAVVRGDAELLSSVPGIGRKTALRVILELKDKIGALSYDLAVAPAETHIQIAASIKEETIAALMALGYSNREVYKVINGFTEDELVRVHSTEDCIKAVLKKIK